MRAWLPLLLASLVAFPASLASSPGDRWVWNVPGGPVQEGPAELWQRLGREATEWFVFTEQGLVECLGGVATWTPRLGAQTAPPVTGTCRAFYMDDFGQWAASATFAAGALLGRGSFAAPVTYVSH